MAAPTKRPHEAGDTGFGERCQAKQTCIDLSQTDNNDSVLDRFMRWAERNNFRVSDKVHVGKNGSCAQYGMVASSDLSEGETLFQIPRPMLLCPQTSAIAELLNTEKDSIESGSGWVPLLLSLMYEYHNPNSTWRPYLDLVPDFNELDLPMFWPRPELEAELRGTGVIEAVDRDLKSISREFNTIVLPFVRKHKTVFNSTECENLEFYKRMVAFVMAYSFTEPVQSSDGEDSDEEGETSPPMMVAMADILNHVAKNNARLQFEKDCLKMVTVKDIKAGEEVFNTYGELPNWQLLQMYGFAEAYPLNHFDTVEVPVSHVVENASDLAVNSADLMEEKKKFLQSLDLLGNGGTFVVGTEGILTDEELEPVLKVLVMDRCQFEEHKEKEGWSDVEEEHGEELEQDRFTFGKMKQLPADWKQLLRKACKMCLTHYPKEEEDQKDTASCIKGSNSRQIYSRCTRIGQRKLLQKLVDSVS